MSDDLYALAADALLLADVPSALAAYAAIRDSNLALDWSGHDRRADRLAGTAYADQGRDPALAGMLLDVPHLPKLRAADIVPCKSCGQAIYWGRSRDGRPVPFDVASGGYATMVNHFETCPTAAQHRSPARNRKGRAA